MDYYRQVRMLSDNFQTVAWIDEAGAKVGKTLKLKDSDDPEREWVVAWASETRIPRRRRLSELGKGESLRIEGLIAHQ